MTDRVISDSLNKAARRMTRVRVWTGFGIIWAVVAVLGAVALWTDVLPALSQQAWVWLAIAAVIASCIWGLLVARGSRDVRGLARRIESKFPLLNSSLLTAIEQSPGDDGQLSFLQQEVLGKAREHARRNDWRSIVPKSRMVLAGTANLCALAAAAFVLSELMHAPRATASIPAAIEEPVTPSDRPADYTVEIEPGDVAVEKGTSLLVLARFPADIPTAAVLTWDTGSPTPQPTTDEAEAAPAQTSLAMTRSLEDPVFAARIAVVDQPMTYSVRFADQESDTYQVTVFEYPRLEQADAELIYPAYTNLEPRVIQDVRRVTAIRGTTLKLTCRLNKPVAAAYLKAEDGSEIALTVSETEPVCEGALELTESAKYQLILTDADQRQNKMPPEFVIKVTDNAEPKLTMVKPRRDIQVSALEEIDLTATLWDDFGVHRAGITFSLAGGQVHEVELTNNVAPRSKEELQHRIFLEDLNAAPDELLSYYFWAEDTGEAGVIRRTMGDMFFAEVRPFEEIFRPGQSPSGQSQQQEQSENAQQAEELAELQKEIISATWKLIRRETGKQVTAEFAKDSTLMLESQQAAVEQLQELLQELEDEQSRQHAFDAMDAMEAAATAFEQAAAESSAEPLPTAMAAAQQAYAGLLKLRAREHEVVRSQQRSQSQSSSQSRSQQQLDELELEDEEDRYETQNSAQQQAETAEQREDRQILSRLRELAQRQQDLNERVKELQSALEQAQTAAEKEEIERQLKRLREEQQQIVRDADELGQRMEQAGNQERMSEQRSQLDEARENARQASESLSQNQVSQAAAQGSRAEEKFEELKEEFQKRTSSAIAEKLRGLKAQAEETAERERQLGEALAGQQEEQQSPEQARPSLKTVDREDDLNPLFEKQRERIRSLNEQIEETIREAEDADQLLLAEKLYDSLRTTQRRSPEQALNQSEMLLRRGLTEDARELESIAQEGLNNLQEGIDEAAEAVLGDETEALRRARSELQRLQSELTSEITRRDPNGAETQSQPGQNGQPSDSNPQSQEGSQASQQQSENAPLSGNSPAGQGERPDAQEGMQPGQPNAGNGQRPGQSPDQQQPQDSQQSPGNQQGQQPGGSGSPQNPSEQSQPGQQQSGGQQGQGQPGQQQAGQQNGGMQPGQDSSEGQQQSNQQGQQPGGQQGQGGQQPGQQPSLRDGGQQGGRGSRFQQPGEQQTQAGPGGSLPNGEEGLQPFMDRIDQNAAPLTGDDYVDWTDRLRDVEELLSDPKLRASAAGIRDRAKEVRREVRRHSAEPNWDLVRDMIAAPLNELEQQVTNELLRRSSDKAVPLDRQPVPAEFESAVREYYRRLGAGR